MQAVATILSACEERQWAHVDTVLAQLTANLQDELSTTVRYHPRSLQLLEVLC